MSPASKEIGENKELNDSNISELRQTIFYIYLKKYRFEREGLDDVGYAFRLGELTEVESDPLNDIFSAFIKNCGK